MIVTYLMQLVKARIAEVMPGVKKAAKAVLRAAVVGGAVAGLTAVANVVPTLAADFHLDPAATGQIVAVVLMARDALKVKGF